MNYQLIRVTSNESNYGPFCIQRMGENKWHVSFRNDETITYGINRRSLDSAAAAIDSNLDDLKAKYPQKEWR